MGKIGIIGGSGLDDPEILEHPREIEMSTPFGPPSSPLKEGLIGEREVVILARHGRSHTIPPSQVNYKANVWALKDAGCAGILATTAVGSLRQEIGRGDLVILDQLIDFTKKRESSFYTSFEPGKPIHSPMAEPFSPQLRRTLIEACSALRLPCHPAGTVVTIEGPRFSTRAESRMFKAWGADVINMSIATEAALAFEAGIPYAAVAMSTDYDSWNDNEAPVSWEAVLKIFSENAEKVTRLLVRTLASLRDL
jgi:5'-methylthioadenosine phosphorylase